MLSSSISYRSYKIQTYHKVRDASQEQAEVERGSWERSRPRHDWKENYFK